MVAKAQVLQLCDAVLTVAASIAINEDLRPIALDDRIANGLVGLLLPNSRKHSIEGVYQVQHVGCVEATAPVARCGRVGNPFGADGIEIGFVLAAVINVFRATAAGKQIHGNVQGLGQNVVNDISMDVGEPEVASSIPVGELCVIEAKHV